MKEVLTKILTGVFGAVIRHALTGIGGAAALKGTSGDSIDPELLASGVAALVVGVAWSCYEKKTRKPEPEKP